MEKKYEIRTIEDLMDTITPDNFANFMIDFTDVMIKVTALKQEVKKISGEYPKGMMKEFSWIDDEFRGVKGLEINGERIEFNQFKKD